MTDVREPEQRARLEPVGARQTLVARAWSPIRRVTGWDVATISARSIGLRGLNEFDLEPKSKGAAIRLSVIIVILIPLLISGLYLFIIASDQYVAEARFAVKQTESVGADDKSKDGATAMSPMALGTGAMNIGGQDAEIIASYIKSRAIIEDVSRTIDVRALFERPEADFWSRLPHDASAEKLEAYWDDRVSVYIEASSGIVTLSVSAFRREDATDLAKAILLSSENLANRMSLKIRFDAIKTAEDEVRRAEGNVRFALSNLTSFRNTEKIIDPVEATKSTSSLLLDLMAQKIQIESQLFVMQRVQGLDAPGINSMRAKLESVNSQITQLRDQMAGDKKVASNMAATLARFETLELEKQFAEKMYAFAHAGVERAHIASIRQQIYLEVFVQPSLPQDYSMPQRGLDMTLITLGLFMTWICGLTITASILDHRL